MSGRIFLDTNVLMYADDLDAGPKRGVARTILERAFRERSGVLSTQVLQEFFAVSTRKLRVDPGLARRKVELLSRLEVVEIDVQTVLSAIDLHRTHGFSIWDALVVRCAVRAGCETLVTEDLQAGRIIDGVRIENPFSPLQG